MDSGRARRSRGWFSRSRRPAGTRAVATVQGGFFGAPWITGAVIVALLGVALEQRPFVLIALLVLATAGLTRGWTALVLRRVAVTLAPSAERCLAGDIVPVALTVRNDKVLPVLWLGIDLDIGPDLEVLDRPSHRADSPARQVIHISSRLGPYERVTWRMQLRAPIRGLHPIGPVTLRSGDPFGFFRARLSPSARATLLVYPEVHQLPDPGLPLREPLGDTRVARQLLADPTRIIGVRDYQPDDPFRAIHWKATARQGRLQVRVEEPSSVLRLGIFLNLDTFDHYWEGLDTDLAEQGIGIAASLASWADRAGYAVGVYANGLVSGSHRTLRVPPARGRDQLPSILTGLARISPLSTMPVVRVLNAEAVRFPAGSTFVLITSRLPEPVVATMAALLAARQRVMLVPLGDCPVPPLRGLTVRRIGYDRTERTEPLAGNTVPINDDVADPASAVRGGAA
ncbi:MAG: DUF58 domain-containing protein [Thermomicrobiales bacterium]